MKRIIFFVAILFLISCEQKSKPYSIAIDKNWFSLALNGQQSSLNGFINDLLLEITSEKKIYFEIVDSNFDELSSGLMKKKYDAILSSMEPYNFNRAKYDFSDDIIKTGFVLVVSMEDTFKALKDMENKHVGYISETGSVIFLQKYPQIFQQAYISVPLMLDDIVNGNLQGAILSVIPANKYVMDLYKNYLKIVYPPINDKAIKLVTLKNQNDELLQIFNSSLSKMKKNMKLNQLKKKWSLPL